MQHLIEVADMISTPTLRRGIRRRKKGCSAEANNSVAAVILLGLRLTGAGLSHTSYVENYQRLFVITSFLSHRTD